MWEVLAIVSLVVAAAFAVKTGHAFFMNRRLARDITQLEGQNALFQTNVHDLTRENAELARLKAALSDEVGAFQQELDELRGICDLVGGMSADSEHKLRCLYEQHKDVLAGHIRSNAMRVLLLLDETVRFEAELTPDIRRKVAVLFGEAFADEVAATIARSPPEQVADELLGAIEARLLSQALLVRNT